MSEIQLFHENTVKLELAAKDKKAVIKELAELLAQDGVLGNKTLFIEDIWKREELSSTGIGMMVAIPHAKSESVKEARVAFGVSREGIDFDSLDGEKAVLFFMIAAPEGSSDLHLKMLANLSRKLISEEFRNSLAACASKEQAMELLGQI